MMCPSPNANGETWLRCIAIIAVVLLCLPSVRSQQSVSRPKAEIKVMGGISTFGNGLDNNLRHTIVGGSLRIYVTRRLSVEPEVLYMRRSDHDRDYVFTPHLAYDLNDPTKRFVPYLIAGVGIEHHQDQFTFADFFNDNKITTRKISNNVVSANVGGGIKMFLTDHLFVAPDVRVGHEPSFRATLSFGYVFAGRHR